MAKKIKCFEITPDPTGTFDVLIVESKENTWREVIDLVEQGLDNQFNDVEWDEIKISVKCVYKTREELDELDV